MHDMIYPKNVFVNQKGRTLSDSGDKISQTGCVSALESDQISVVTPTDSATISPSVVSSAHIIPVKTDLCSPPTDYKKYI